MSRKTTRTCGACGRKLTGRRLEDAVYSRHTGNYYCGARDPCKRPRRKVDTSKRTV